MCRDFSVGFSGGKSLLNGVLHITVTTSVYFRLRPKPLSALIEWLHFEPIRVAGDMRRVNWGCGVELNVEPASPVHSPILQHTDVNGVSTWAVVPDSYDASKAYPWIIYDHGFGETISSITTYPPQSNFVQSLVTAGYVVIASEYRNLACWGDMQCAEDIANLQSLLAPSFEPHASTLCNRGEHGRDRHLERDLARYPQASGGGGHLSRLQSG